MLLQNKKVAIIGAGPVGPKLARLLQKKDIDVTVYERDKDANIRIWGGTLDLHQSSGQQALQEAGLLPSYFDLAIPMGRTMADEQGNVFFSVEPDYRNPEINRNMLRNLLLDSLITDTVIWDCKFTAMEEHTGKWMIHFENQPDAIAELVVGANGGMSAVRNHVTDSDVESTGTLIIQGEVQQPALSCPAFYRLCNDNILMAAHGGNLLVANPNNNGLLTYNVIFKTPERFDERDYRDTNGVRNYLSQRFSGWSASYQELFRATNVFWRLPTKILRLNQPWRKDRRLPVTLIGDAAHLMPPFAGQGVNTGLTDALTLYRNLTNEKFKTIADAIHDYEETMFDYAKKAQLATSQNETEMQHPGFCLNRDLFNSAGDVIKF